MLYEVITLACEHPGRVPVLALEGEPARGERARTRDGLAHQPPEDLARILVARQRHLADLGAR